MSSVSSAGGKPRPLNCTEAADLLMQRLYGESEDQLQEDDSTRSEDAALNQHLAVCEDCRRELASLRALQETLAEVPAVEPSQHLLTQTRHRLSAALDAEARRPLRRWFSHGSPASLAMNLQALRSAPFAAAAMLLLGAGVGSLGGYRAASQAQPESSPARINNPMPQAGAPIASVSSVEPQPDGKGISVSYSRLVPETATGSTDDPFIRQILARGVQSPTDPAVQDNATRLLTDACNHGPHCDDGNVLSALMTAARYGGDPALRSEALRGLEPYIASDMRVRDAVLGSVMSDHSPQVRGVAVRMLSPVETDSSVRQVLHSVSMADHDPEIRDLSRNMSQQASDVGMQIQ